MAGTLIDLMVSAEETVERELDDKDGVELFLPVFATPSEVVDIVKRGPSTCTIGDASGRVVFWQGSDMSGTTSEETTVGSVSDCSHEMGSISQEKSCILDGAVLSAHSNRDSSTRQKQALLLEGIGT